MFPFINIAVSRSQCTKGNKERAPTPCLPVAQSEAAPLFPGLNTSSSGKLGWRAWSLQQRQGSSPATALPASLHPCPELLPGALDCLHFYKVLQFCLVHRNLLCVLLKCTPKVTLAKPWTQQPSSCPRNSLRWLDENMCVGGKEYNGLSDEPEAVGGGSEGCRLQREVGP